MIISSPHNDRIKLVRALQGSGKARRKEGKIVLEGVRLIGDAISARALPDFVLYTADAVDKAGSSLLELLNSQKTPCLEVTPDMMQHAADTETPQGMIAVVPMPEISIPETVSLALILDGIADPGNLGTILRTAAAAGVDVVVLAPNCVDPFNPKVLRGGMGAHFRLPMVRKSWWDIVDEFGHLASYLADANSKIAYYDVNWTQPSALVIGSEAHGADTPARQFAKTSIMIPMANGVESLNAAMATGILLFEIRRQRALS